MLCDRCQRRTPAAKLLLPPRLWQGYSSMYSSLCLDSEDATYMVTLAAVR